MNLDKLKEALRQSFDASTAHPDWQKQWEHEDVAYGQCAVATLVVNDYLGGEMLYDSKLQHFWNRLPDGTEFDATREQFRNGLVPHFEKTRTREEMLAGEKARLAKTPDRYWLLKQRCGKILRAMGEIP